MFKPNFSGKWTVNLEQSRLQIPAPTASKFEIDHREPQFQLKRTHVYGDQSNTIAIELTTDGKQYEQEFGELRARTRVYWDGSILVLDSQVVTKDDAGTNVVRYSLENEGRNIVAVERWHSARMSYDNTWVLDKQ